MPVTDANAKYVVKMEPHSNGPLFVEIHCLLNTAKNNGEYCKSYIYLYCIVIVCNKVCEKVMWKEMEQLAAVH